MSTYYGCLHCRKKLKNNIYNLGLSSANLTKISLARKIKNIIRNITIKIVYNISDPDKRDYYVSNKKIEKKGFKARINLETGINELVNYFKYSNKKNINNY
jgi:nucleoside-diphosphate-sugar epimerase